jgi:oligoendopeptidase F
MPNERLPTAEEIMGWSWPRIAPFYGDLLVRPLGAESIASWLADWTAISALLDEANTRFTIATTVNTADEAMEARYKTFVDEVQPQADAAEQRVKQRLLDSGLSTPGFDVPLRKLRTDADLFREDNLPLLAEARKQTMDYEKLAGSRTVQWDGREIPLVQIYPILQEPDRGLRERAWRTASARIIEDTPTLAALWRQMMTVRGQIAHNAGFKDYRAYRWRQLYRFDYTPDDAQRFHTAIEQTVVPAARRVAERRRQALEVSTLRPWDDSVDPHNRPPLRPYTTVDELVATTHGIFRAVDPRLGEYFGILRDEHLLDLDSRKNKAPGGYSLTLNAIKRPFIFTNAVGTHGDVQTLLHEGGHAFHGLEMAHLPYLQQRQEQMLPMEFMEVASMAMELLAAPYLTALHGGFYDERQAARARLENLESIITFWPYMAMIDALQHWMYEHADEAANLERCDDVWVELEDRFRPHLDWSGLERERRAAWHRQRHVFTDPFYYIEYGLAQLGAVQIWANALRDQRGAVAAYRQALALGGTVTLPELYAAAGARFAFDAATLGEAVALIERVSEELLPLAEG